MAHRVRQHNRRVTTLPLPHFGPELVPTREMAIKKIHSKQLTLILPVMGTAVLALTVFLWGVEYKCSLYPVHGKTPTSVPVAKLLSERERPAPGAHRNSLRAPLSLAALFALWLLTVPTLRTLRAGFNPTLLPTLPTPIDGLRPASLYHFSFRPPPGLLL